MSEKYSVHTFMFPFRWDFIASDKGKEKISYSKRTNLSDFDTVFSKCKTLIRRSFETFRDSDNYNEYIYFHEYVRRALYDTGNVGESPSKNEVLYYDLDGSEGDVFIIQTRSGRYLELFPSNFCIHVYSTGIGILSYNLRNTKNVSESDILEINEYGRRIYPQFIAGNSVDFTKTAFLSDRISGKIGHIQFSEDFTQYNNGVYHHSTFLPPDHIKKIFGYKGHDEESSERLFVFRSEHERKGNIRISKITDDRMFFLCYYHNADKVNELAKIEEINNEKQFVYFSDSYWYSFINGDKSVKDISVKNMDFQRDEVTKCTYARWIDQKSIDLKSVTNPNDANDGVLFGTTRDSFVCLGAWDRLEVQMTTMYYQMAVLCLAQRASVLRFSYEVSLITDILEEKKDATQDIKDLYKNYIQFINKIYFREVTPQIQGIELYKQFQDVMGLEKEVKDLDGEISELHAYVSMVEQSILSKVAVWFLPAGVLVGMLGMNTFTTDQFKFSMNPHGPTWVWFGIVIVISVAAAVILTLYFNRKTR